jgi:hypothetical protein
LNQALRSPIKTVPGTVDRHPHADLAGCYVLMEHHPDEAEHGRYAGLHQWNFSMNDAGEFIIGSKRGQVNVSRKYARLCRIQCEVIDNGEKWLITRILKSEP